MPLSKISALSLGVLTLLLVFCSASSYAGSTEKAQTADFGDIYYRETIRILNKMWDNEQQTIDRITTHIAETLNSGRTVVWDCTAGHSCIMENDPALPCLPKTV
jgi:hypothetical protein